MEYIFNIIFIVLSSGMFAEKFALLGINFVGSHEKPQFGDSKEIKLAALNLSVWFPRSC